MNIYLPIAEMSVSFEAVFAIGILVGFMSGVFGIGGGFLSTPLLIFLGVPPTVAVGTQSSQLAATSSSGFIANLRRGNIDLKIGTLMIAGSLLGNTLGIFIFHLLKQLGQIDVVIALLYVFLLGIIGMMMLFECFMSLSKQKKRAGKQKYFSHHPFFRSLPYKTRFPKSKIYMSALMPVIVGFLGGILISIMGIGGGFIMVPAMIYFLGMPTMLVPGTSLFQILFSASFSCVMHASFNHNVDIILGIMLIFGGVLGTQFGVLAASRIKGLTARFCLAFMITGVSFFLARNLILPPENLYQVVIP